MFLSLSSFFFGHLSSTRPSTGVGRGVKALLPSVVTPPYFGVHKVKPHFREMCVFLSICRPLASGYVRETDVTEITASGSVSIISSTSLYVRPNETSNLCLMSLPSS